jgi:hypothetical protein
VHECKAPQERAANRKDKEQNLVKMARVWEAMEAGQLVIRPLKAKLGDTILGQGQFEARSLYKDALRVTG